MWWYGTETTFTLFHSLHLVFYGPPQSTKNENSLRQIVI